MKYDVDYFIRKFEAIPEERWNNYLQYDPGRHTYCAFGHCMTDEKKNEMAALHIKYGSNGERTLEGIALIKILEPIEYPTVINNGKDFRYQQPTPKQRILDALRDIKAMEQKPEVKVKERIVYVAVDERVRELSRSELSEQ